MSQNNEEDNEILMLAHKNLEQEFEKARCDPWMLHVPMPRVTEILAQALFSSFSTCYTEEQEKVIVPLCIAASHPSKSVAALLSKFPPNSYVWDALSKSLDEGKCLSSETLVLLYTQKASILERHLIHCLQDVGHQCIDDLSEVTNTFGCDGNETVIHHYLGHNCCNNASLKRRKIKYGFLPPLLNSKESLFSSAFKLLGTFLMNCNYSVASVKTVKVFANLITNGVNLKCLPSEFAELWTLISSPPCIHCNDILTSDSDLSVLSERISYCLQKLDTTHIPNLRTILCMKCEWLVFCKYFSSVRTMFLLTDIL